MDPDDVETHDRKRKQRKREKNRVDTKKKKGAKERTEW
jgi:hypothetical protein